MKTYLLTAAAFGAAMVGSLALSTGPASAGAYCLTNNDSPNTFVSCNFPTMHACRSIQHGTGGSCVRNVGQGANFQDDDGYVDGPYGAYNRYDGPVYGGPGYGGGYVRRYGW